MSLKVDKRSMQGCRLYTLRGVVTLLGGLEGEGVTSTQHMTGTKLASQLASFLTQLGFEIE